MSIWKLRDSVCVVIWGDYDEDFILGIVVESGLLALSMQKFASNVMDNLLR